MKNFLLSGIALLVLSSCSGTLSTYQLGALESTIDNENPIKQGIIYYPRRKFIETYQNTEIRDTDGKITHRVNGVGSRKCDAVTYEVPAIRIAYNEPWVIKYKPGLLENYTFGVTLDDGALNSINTVSSPDRGETLSNVASSAVSAISALEDESAVPSCSTTPILINWEREPEK